MIDQIKKIVQEQEKIENAESRLYVRKKKLRERLSKIRRGYYIIDGNLWEVGNDVGWPGHKKLLCRGEFLEETKE